MVGPRRGVVCIQGLPQHPSVGVTPGQERRDQVGGNHQPSAGHGEDVARMVAKRFLTTIEPATGKGLNEELVKQLTGNDTMAARYMRSDFFEFSPTGKIHYFTNHLPRMSADTAMWRRVRMFVWGVTIPVEQRVADLGETLAREEGAGILAWLVRGCEAWAERGLHVAEV